MEVLTRILAAAALLAAAGCSFLREPTPVEAMGDQPSVHALLMTGSDTVRVLLQRVGRGGGYPDGPVAARPIQGAEVSLAVGGETLRLNASRAAGSGCVAQSVGSQLPADTTGCYFAVLPGGVRPGSAYALRVRLPGGGTIEGEATALPALRVESPAAGTRIQVAPRSGGQDGFTRIPLRIRGAEGAAGVSADFIPTAVYSRGARVADAVCGVEYIRGEVFHSDAEGITNIPVYGVHCSSRTLPGSPSDPQPRADSVRVKMRVLAYDSAYVRYVGVQERNSVAAREVREGVTGAIGIFAAAARTEHEVVLIPCQPGQSCAAP